VCGNRCGRIAEFVAETGLIVPASDAPALAQAWLNLLQQSVAQRQALGEQAKQRVAARYSLDAVVSAYHQLLQGETYSDSSA